MGVRIPEVDGAFRSDGVEQRADYGRDRFQHGARWPLLAHPRAEQDRSPLVILMVFAVFDRLRQYLDVIRRDFLAVRTGPREDVVADYEDMKLIVIVPVQPDPPEQAVGVVER